VDSTHATILVHVKFSALSGGPYQVYALLNPAPNNDLLHTTGETLGAALVASGSGAGTESGQVFKQRRDASDGMKNYPDEKGGKEVPLIATAFAADPPFIRTSNGFFGTSDGATDLYRHLSMNWTYAQASHGNVVQTGQTTLDGVNQTEATFAIGFGSTTGAALSAAEQSLASGFNSIDDAYVAGWRSHLARIKPAPSWLTDEERRLYNSSALVLSASEDKTNPGAFVASPSMPWVNEFIFPVGPYHLVWARDLYQIATALISIGDLDGAERALTFLFDRQQKTDGSFPQNSTVDGKPFFDSLQLDEVGLPLVLAWQLKRFDRATYASHVRPAADFIVAHGPSTPEARWEEQSGWSPSTIAAEIAGLVCAADIANRNDDTASAKTYLETADVWRKNLASWTVSTNGPLSPNPYYLRLTKNHMPNDGATYNVLNSGPTVDQRAVADAGFLELTRLGIEPANDPTIVNSLAVVDQTIGDVTPTGMYWHRYSDDGYGEQRDGSPWNYGFPKGTEVTFGRLWVLLAGERGEYDLLNNQPDAARKRLADMSNAATETYLLSEQVWDSNPPSNDPHSGFVAGRPTTSASPLAWTHAQFLRLVWSLADGHPIEQPSVIACRYIERSCD
jgi:glucoamylase